MKTINESEFKELTKQEKLSIIQLSAPWCGACKALKPKMEELSLEQIAKANILYLDVDDNPQIAIDHGVRSIPTVLFYKKGTLLETVVGNKSKEEIKSLIDKHSQE